jgi:hypothetical protein
VIPDRTRVFYLFQRLPGDTWRTNLTRLWRSRGTRQVHEPGPVDLEILALAMEDLKSPRKPSAPAPYFRVIQCRRFLKMTDPEQWGSVPSDVSRFQGVGPAAG